jgi:Ca2+-binding RTX toxin-like protein
VSIRRFTILGVGAAFLLATGVAHAQSAATCSFDGPSATLTVTVNGIASVVTRTAAGQIRLNGVDCVGATATTTDTILVNGGALADQMTFSGSFTPGLTAEADGASEIEIVFSLGGGKDNIRINFTNNPDTVTFTAGGIDIGNDGDEDITTAGVEQVRPYTLLGDDTIDCTAYTGGGILYPWAGEGNDTIYGSAQADYMYGEEGVDSLYGGPGNDKLTGGPGDDFYYGEDGNDKFMQDMVVDGNDTFDGGPGRDIADYSKRTTGVNVTVDNGLADDGEPGVEFDSVDGTMEDVTGGEGADVLVGSVGDNVLRGNGGNDEIYGGGGRDTGYGGLGDDILVGDSGPDILYGEGGNDSLDGGSGADTLDGSTGMDTITGGTGTDTILGQSGNDIIFNNDGQADSVDCGTGTADDAEVDPLDTLTGCEL